MRDDVRYRRAVHGERQPFARADRGHDLGGVVAQVPDGDLPRHRSSVAVGATGCYGLGVRRSDRLRFYPCDEPYALVLAIAGDLEARWDLLGRRRKRCSTDPCYSLRRMASRVVRARVDEASQQALGLIMRDGSNESEVAELDVATAPRTKGLLVQRR